MSPDELPALSVPNTDLTGAPDGHDTGKISIASVSEEPEMGTNALKTLHNLNSPIGHLPTEILSAIFILLKEPGTIWAIRLRWIDITFVCRHWRMVALDCSDLWTNLPMICPAFTEHILPRSKNAPIHLSLESNHTKSAEAWQAVCDRIFKYEAHRLESLSVVIDPMFSLRPVGHLLVEAGRPDVAFAALKNLVLNCPGLEIPPGFLKGPQGTVHAPSLTDLVLIDVKIPWSSIPFAPNIQSLAMIFDKVELRPTPVEFVDALKSMPRLQHLTLHGILPQSAIDPLLPGFWSTLGTLPNLQQLILKDRTLLIARNLLLLNFTHATMVSLDCLHPQFSISIIKMLLTIIEKSWAFARCKIKEMHTQAIDSSRRLGDHQFDFLYGPVSSSASPSESCGVGSGKGLNLPRLSLTLDIGNLSLPDIFSELSRTLNLTSVSKLVVSTHPSFVQEWRTVYGSMATTTSLTVGSDLSLFGFLPIDRDATFAALREEGDKTTPLFPALKTLCLENIGSEGYPEGLSLAQTLFKYLGRRSRSPWRIQELLIGNHVDFSEQDLAELQATDLGFRIHWNGKEYPPGSVLPLENASNIIP